MDSYLEKVDKIHPDILSNYLATGNGEGIPKEIQLFLRQIQWAAEIYEHERNITRCSKKLRTRIITQQQIDISERTCKARIYEALRYFNIDNNVPIKVWESNYADKYEDYAKMATLQGDYKTAIKSLELANACRTRSAEIAEADRDLGVVFLLSPDISPEMLGFKKKSLKEIARKHNEGYYLKLIDSLPLEKEDKRRLLRDADIEDATFTEITTD